VFVILTTLIKFHEQLLILTIQLCINTFKFGKIKALYLGKRRSSVYVILLQDFNYVILNFTSNTRDFISSLTIYSFNSDSLIDLHLIDLCIL